MVGFEEDLGFSSSFGLSCVTSLYGLLLELYVVYSSDLTLNYSRLKLETKDVGN